MIDDFDVARPMFTDGVARIRDVLSTRVAGRTSLYVESLDRQRRAAVPPWIPVEERLAHEYEGQPLSLIIASGDSSLAMADRLRHRWQRNIPIAGLLFSSRSQQQASAPAPISDAVVLRLGDVNAATAQHIASLIPSLDHLLVIGNASNEAESAAQSMRAVLGPDVTIDALAAPSPEELVPHVARLSPNAAVVFLGVGVDSRGRVWQAREYLQRLVDISPRPVFGWQGSFMGAGIVGGPILDGAEMGLQLGRVAADIIEGTDSAYVTPRVISPTRLVYDWRMLRRYGIPLERIPRGATVLYRPLAIWESYPRTSIAIGALLALLLVSVGILWYSRRRIRAANAAQLATSRRLLLAQDQERVRIARDLHDDLCQEMTMLAIEVASTTGESLARESIASRVRALIERTRRLAVGLHATHVGSMPFRDALASHIATVQSRAGLEIRLSTAESEREPAPDIAVALFRAVQEALQNIIRHAEATFVTITVSFPRDHVRIEIADDGVGFDPAQPHYEGLGLASMRERMASIGGTFAIRSAPFAGTTVVLESRARAVRH